LRKDSIGFSESSYEILMGHVGRKVIYKIKSFYEMESDLLVGITSCLRASRVEILNLIIGHKNGMA